MKERKTGASTNSASIATCTPASSPRSTGAINSQSAASVYQNIGVNYENVVVIPAIQEAVKSVMAQYTAEELITMRQTVGNEMQQNISEKLVPYGFSTESVNIVDFQFSEEFNAAIEAKQTAQQNALKAEQDLARVKVEAEQAITQAQAEAESYRLKSQELTDEMIMMEFIDKWDGKLPTVVSDGQALFSMDSILESAQSAAAAE